MVLLEDRAVYIRKGGEGGMWRELATVHDLTKGGFIRKTLLSLADSIGLARVLGGLYVGVGLDIGALAVITVFSHLLFDI